MSGCWRKTNATTAGFLSLQTIADISSLIMFKVNVLHEYTVDNV